LARVIFTGNLRARSEDRGFPRKTRVSYLPLSPVSNARA
jgi:hypothetical protein